MKRNRAQVFGEEAIGKKVRHGVMIEMQFPVRALKGRNAGLSSAVSPGGNLPYISRGDVLIGPVALSQPDRVLQVLGGLVPGCLGGCLSDGLCGCCTFSVPPTGVVCRGSPFSFHDRSAGGIKGRVNVLEACVDCGRRWQGLGGGGMCRENLMPPFPFVGVKVSVKGIGAIRFDMWNVDRGCGGCAD